jgi:hypothetical protein
MFVQTTLCFNCVRFDGKCPNEVEIMIGASTLPLSEAIHPSIKIWGDLALRVVLSVPLNIDDGEMQGRYLLALLRFLACSDEELNDLINSHLRGIVGDDKGRIAEMGPFLQRLISTPFISIRNETAAWELVGVICDSALKRYPTTRDEDWTLINSAQELGEGGNSDSKQIMKYSNAWNALVHVHGEKQILAYWLERSKDRIASASK